MAYQFALASSKGRTNIPFGVRFTPKGARNLCTYKVRFRVDNGDFFARYLAGRLPDYIVSQDNLMDKKGVHHVTFTLATFDYNEFVVFQKAVEQTEIYGVKQKLQDLENAHRARWEETVNAWHEIPYSSDDDLPF